MIRTVNNFLFKVAQITKNTCINVLFFGRKKKTKVVASNLVTKSCQDKSMVLGDRDLPVTLAIFTTVMNGEFNGS